MTLLHAYLATTIGFAPIKTSCKMPRAKIHVLQGQYDDARLSGSIQKALIDVLGVPPDDFYQIIHLLPRSQFLHTPSFLGMTYSDDLILIEITFIAGRPKETRLALLKALNEGVAAGASISPDDLILRGSGREHLIWPRLGTARLYIGRHMRAAGRQNVLETCHDALARLS